jgi:type II secretory pathway pseudopilin PulG
MIKHLRGFTVIELMLVIMLFAGTSILFFSQKKEAEIIASDDKKKIAINAMYYNLEEIYYPTNKYYPQSIDSDILKSVDPNLFKDPNGKAINTIGSAYTYSPINCVNGKCRGYTLKAVLDNENDFVKSSRNNQR